MIVDPGELDTRITITETVRLSDGIGGYTNTDSDVCTIWAKLKFTSGAEIFKNYKTDAESLYSFIIRYRTDINETMKIQLDSITYNITAIDRSARREGYMVVMAKRG
jgi:SPP1 family predicted phage head-tail adaptor